MIRNSKFPMENTLGSIFKNITHGSNKIYAWKLIDELNLRGKTINNITLHNNHPNIFVNSNNATPDNLNNLIENIKKNILEKYNIEIDKEVEYIKNQNI